MITLGNYRLEKIGLLKCLKSYVSEHLWTVNMLKAPKDYLILHGSIFCNIFWSLWKKFISKNTNLVVSEILRLFVNILTNVEKSYFSVNASL